MQHMGTWSRPTDFVWENCESSLIPSVLTSALYHEMPVRQCSENVGKIRRSIYGYTIYMDVL